MAKKRINIEVRGVAKLVAKAQPKLVAKPIREMFEAAGEDYLNLAKLRAPVDIGLLRSTLARGAKASIFQVEARQVPRFVKVGTSHVDQKSGFPYPKVLDVSPRYHHRGGGAGGSAAPAASGEQSKLQGTRTRGWFSGVKKEPAYLMLIRRRISTAERAIKKNWNR